MILLLANFMDHTLAVHFEALQIWEQMKQFITAPSLWGKKSIQSQTLIQLMTIICYAENKDITNRKGHYLNANTSIHIKGCDCVRAGPWEGLQTFISHPNYSKQAVSHFFMTSVIETIARKTTNRHKVTACLKVSSQGHGIGHESFICSTIKALYFSDLGFLYTWYLFYLIN